MSGVPSWPLQQLLVNQAMAAAALRQCPLGMASLRELVMSSWAGAADALPE